MKEYIESIEKSLQQRNFHSALFMALSIPDICGSLETPEAKNGERAKRWFTENLKGKYFPDSKYEHLMATCPAILDGVPEVHIDRIKREEFTTKVTPKIYWDLRNAFTHSASDLARDVKIHITYGDSHLIMFDNELQISSKVFCQDICDAANAWLERMRDVPEVWPRIISRAEIKNVLFDGMVRIG